MDEMESGSIVTRPIKVVFFHRKPRGQNFSVEILFDEIRKHLPNNIEPIVSVASHTSNGLWKRLYISIEAAFRQKWGDINHITGDVNFIGVFLKKRRTVLTILDVGFMKHPSKYARSILRLFWIIIPVKRSGIVTTISQATKDELLKYVACDPNKVKVVYVPISDQFRPKPKPFNTEKPVILQLGTAPNKNIERLIESIKDINCHLEIVGKLTEQLRNKLKAYNISHCISYNLTDAEVRQKYEFCDLVTLISTYEGFGMPIVEANVVGRPVITSNLLSMPEVAGNAAHLADPYDIEDMRNGILKVIEDEKYREQLVTNGYENAKRFSVEKIVGEYCDIYKQIAINYS